MRTLISKSSISKAPRYLDGIAHIYIIEQDNSTYSESFLVDTNEFIYFEQLSVTERIRYEFEARSNKIVDKIRVQQPNHLTPFHALKIGDEFYKIFNNYKFTNNDGYKQSDLTLEECFLEVKDDSN